MTPRLDYDRLVPDAAKALGAVYGYLLRSGLEKRLLDLAFLRASQINGCAYCVSTHSHDLLQGGLQVSTLVLVQVWREAGETFSVREQAALAWAEIVTQVADSHVPDDAFKAARAVFSDKELADLTVAIGLINAYNRLAISFRKTPLGVGASA